MGGWRSACSDSRGTVTIHVQFFVKAYRKGDPSLGGIYGTRLVLVPTKSP